MNSIQIRRGVTADAAALATFAARTFEETFSADNRPGDMRVHLAKSYGVQQQTQELTDTNVITLLAERNGVLVAYAQVRRQPAPGCVTQEQPVELQRFYVDRPEHGSGVARELMTAVRQAATELGGRHLWLGVWEHNPRAIAFYTKEGFVDVGSTAFYVGPDRQTDRVLVAVVHPAGPRST
jgi:GNAT superfamily N-acetyltransferase